MVIWSSGYLVIGCRAVAGVALTAAALAPLSAQSTAPDPVVWTTGVTCARPQRLRVAITHHEAAVYRGVISLCRERRADRQAATTPVRVWKFSFVAKPREFAPTGSEQSHQIDGRLWEVAADIDSVRLGVSFAIAGQVLLNTTHVVSPTTLSSNTLAPELSITSEPQEK